MRRPSRHGLRGHLRSGAVVLAGLGLGACGSSELPRGEGTPDSGVPSDVGSAPAVTFFRDVKPIIDAKCVACHQPGAIGPFDLTEPEAVAQLAPVITNQVTNRWMPPWPPDDACNTYRYDRSLTDEQVGVIEAWAEDGAPLGDPSEAGEPIPSEQGGLSRIDLRLQVPEPNTPEGRDDYHCFVIDWPSRSAPTFVTGFGLEPGNPALVHHANMYLAGPAAAEGYRAEDAAADGPGYPCFGGVFGAGITLMGAWAPGSLGLEFPEGTGIQVEGGSVLVLEMHFNTGVGREGADQSTVLVRTEPTVERRAAILPLTGLTWPSGGMPIPAGEAAVRHEAVYEGPLAQQAVAFLAPWLSGQVLEIHGAGVHMHYLGRRAFLDVGRSGGGRDCVIDVPDWDFDWQSGYILNEPMRFDPTQDSLRLQCVWDNTADNQPVIDGVQRDPVDVNWGSDSDDEMCIGYLYVTAGQ